MTKKLAATAIVIMTALAVAIGARTGRSQNDSGAAGKQSHCDWLANRLTEAESVKVGDTRSSLLQDFTGDGGLSNRLQRTYVLRKCNLIKVDVEFAPVGGKQLANGRPSLLDETPHDVIVKISRPYIALPVSD